MITTKVIPSPAGNFNLVYYIPDGKGPFPLIIMIPGDGETGSDPNKAYVNGPMVFAKNGWNPPFMIAFAQTPYHGGTFGNPVALPFLRAVMQELTNGKYPVDTSRIYLTGLSYGADHVMYYMQKEDDAHYIPVAAIIPMSMNMYGSGGNYPNDSIAGNDLRFKKTPIWAFCGNSDPFLAPMQRFNNVLAPAAGINAKLTIYSGGHGGWNPQYDPKGPDIYDWMLQYSSGTVVAPPPPPVIVPVPRTIKSVLFTYSDGTTYLVD